MRTLILTARTSSSFDINNLMNLIDCLPGTQKRSLEELMQFFPQRQIVLNLSENAFDTTFQRICSRLNHVFDVMES